MSIVKHKILVLSGNGGVGKSTFSSQPLFVLAGLDHQVGLMDIDICGPSIPKILGLEGQEIHHSNLGWSPIYVEDNLGVMSIGTSDEHISIVQNFVPTGIDVAIAVTTPQEVSLIDVRKEVSFCKKVGVPVLRVVENMNGLSQPLMDVKFVKLKTASSIEVLGCLWKL